MAKIGHIGLSDLHWAAAVVEKRITCENIYVEISINGLDVE
jgi:hypothetical protein